VQKDKRKPWVKATPIPHPEAAEETGFIQRVPVLDAKGKPTGQTEFRYGAEGEKGYLKWLARTHAGYFAALYGRLIPLDVAEREEIALLRAQGYSMREVARRLGRAASTSTASCETWCAMRSNMQAAAFVSYGGALGPRSVQQLRQVELGAIGSRV
jgi:hypothetical protein